MQAMRLAEQEAVNAITGNETAAYLSGPKGIGKSHAITEALKKTKKQTVRVTPNRYDDFLHAVNDAGSTKAVFCDEGDLIFQTQKNLNVLKLLTDRKGPRTYEPFFVDSEDEPLGGKPKRVRSTLLCEAPILVCTNQDLSKPFKEALRHHHEAVFERAVPVIIPDDREATLEYSIYIGLTTDVLNHDYMGRRVSLTNRSQALDWFHCNADRLSSVSVRTLENINAWMHQYGAGSAKLETLLDPKRPNHTRSSQNDWAEMRLALTASGQSPAIPSAKVQQKRETPAEAEPALEPSFLSDLALQQAKVRAAALVQARGSREDIPPVMQAAIRDLSEEGLPQSWLAANFKIEPNVVNTILANRGA